MKIVPKPIRNYQRLTGRVVQITNRLSLTKCPNSRAQLQAELARCESLLRGLKRLLDAKIGGAR